MLELGGDDCEITDLEFVCVGSTNIYAGIKGCAVYGLNVDRATILRNRITGHQSHGICLQTTDGSLIAFNRLSDGVRGAGFNHETCGNDITIYGDSHKNRITGNRCFGAILNGIVLQGVGITGPATQTFNMIDHNHVGGCGGHGIVQYEKETADICYGNPIIGNIVMDILGDIPNHNADPNPYIYGNGIYVQGYDHTLIVGNTVRRTNLNSQIDTSPIPCAAIAHTNTSSGVIIGNTIELSAAYGIYTQNSNQFGQLNDHVLIEGNRISECTRAGIRVANQPGAKLRGNSSSRNLNHGIHLIGAAFSKYVEVIGNTCNDNVGAAIDGINIDESGAALESPIIVQNTCLRNGRYGIGFDTASAVNVILLDNILDDNPVREISIGTGITFRHLRLLTALGTSSNSYFSLQSEAPELIVQDATASGNLTLTETSARGRIFTAAQTAGRDITLPAVGATTGKIDPCAEWYFLRAAAATGAFNILIKNSSASTLATLSAAKQWARLRRAGSLIFLIETGTLP